MAHIEKCLVPNLAATTRLEINFLALNYEDGPGISNPGSEKLHIHNIARNTSRPSGFAENHNHIFHSFPAVSSFVLMNPDCIPLPGSVDGLLAAKTADAAIVEGRQWPFEHPKEYDAITMETPWASFAFALIDSNFYRAARGMDELYFLYCEDVDLSWRAWLMGYRILYEPKAQIMHFTDGYFARPDRISREQYYSTRNFLLLCRKFFGEASEKDARQMLRENISPELYRAVVQDYQNNLARHIDLSFEGKVHPNIRLYGLNQFAKHRNLQ